MYIMKKLVYLLCLLLSGFMSVHSDRYTTTRQNPLPVAFGDPFILKASDGKFYMYGTGGVQDGFKTCVSDDLVNWTDLGRVYQGNMEGQWCVANFWAPEVYEIDGKYYLWFSADWRENPDSELENFRIGVAVADRPSGPFTDLMNRPLFDPGYPIIDANLLFDNGRVYLYYSRCCYKNPVESEIADWAREQGWFDEIEESWVYGVEISPDFSDVIGEPALLLRPPTGMNDRQAAWESRSVTSREVNRRWTEGSFIFREKDTYYMMYSANYFGGKNYAVGYATSRNPLGPFVKADNNPVLQKNTDEGGEVTGTGHNMVFSIAGKRYCVYHGRTEKTGNERMVFIDPLEILPDGQLVVHGPTTGRPTGESLKKHEAVTTPVFFGDPFIMLHDGVYYAYGTSSPDGIAVYTSNDLLTWQTPRQRLAMHKNDVYGEKWFWAPEVFHVNGKFYMYYSGDEHICVATADNPLGPFRQQEQKPMIDSEKCIDNSLFIDDDGKPYLFFDRFNDGLNIWVAELEENLTDIRMETMQKCINVSQPWEEVWPRVNEGVFVIKHKDVYYMTYSANSYESPFYGIGVATATKVTGPWTKYDSNPIYQNVGDLVGIGHSALFTDKDGKLRIVFHSHHSRTQIHPRIMHISTVSFLQKEGKEIMTIDPDYFTPVLEVK